MYKISHEIYTKLSEELIEKISSIKYYSGVIEFECDDVDIRFVATLIPHFMREKFNNREILSLHELVPVWWEMHTTTLDGECINDFDFNTFKEYICQ